MCAELCAHVDRDAPVEKKRAMHSTACSPMRQMIGRDAFAVPDAELLVADLTY